MKIVNREPPIMHLIQKNFDIDRSRTVFTFGNTLYNPSGNSIPPDLLVHEMVHEKQQKAMGVMTWWRKYIDDPVFRLSQEVEAYRAQYEYVCSKVGAEELKTRFLDFIVEILSSPLYGKCTTPEEARKLITEPTGVKEPQKV